MPRLVVNGWGIAEGVLDAAKNRTNHTDVTSLETKVIEICRGGTVVYTSNKLIRNLVFDATWNLLL